MTVTTLTRAELEVELERLRVELDEIERRRVAALAERNEVCRLLVDREEVRLSDVARLAGVSPSAVAFALGKYQRSGRRREGAE